MPNDSQQTPDPIGQPYRIGNHLVAGIWRYMLPAELQRMSVPAERHATCMSCPKVVSDQFRADYRCCTYHPRIPNFLLGLALLHDAKAEQAFAALAAAGMLLPEGMIPSPKKWARYVTEVAEENFGKSNDVLCPLLNPSNGFCGVYAFRNAVCSTFYCHNDNGSKGEKFWQALETLASQCEMALAQWAMNELGFSVDAYFKRLNRLAPEHVSQEPKHGWTKKAQRQLWGSWYGREHEFFKACGQLISDNRHRLWDIALTQGIAEAEAFERASLGVIPKAHRGQAASEHDEVEGGESESPAVLWQEVRKAHERLWTVPGGELSLNPRLAIHANLYSDAEERFYGHYPHIVSLRRRSTGKGLSWREFVSADTAAALQLFSTPRAVSTPFLSELSRLTANQDPLHFIAEWHAKKALVAPTNSPL